MRVTVCASSFKQLIKTGILVCLVAPVFLVGEEWKTVYLASFPRSGNHWVRFLVEEATHIATGSVYRDKDYPHLRDLFPWGGYCTNHGYEGNCRFPTKDDPVLIKTHYPYFPRVIDPQPKQAICLIRHPVDAFWSFYRYKGGSENSRMPADQLNKFIQGYKNFYAFWESQSNVIFIRYEDLHENPAYYLREILQTGGYSWDNADIERAVSKYSPVGRPLKHIDCFDEESIELIKTELSELLNKYHYDF